MTWTVRLHQLENRVTILQDKLKAMELKNKRFQQFIDDFYVAAENLKGYIPRLKTLQDNQEFGASAVQPTVLALMFSLPKHLQTTFFALSKNGVATASEIAGATGKCRAVESGYLNNLVVMGYASKIHSGRRVVFQANASMLRDVLNQLKEAEQNVNVETRKETCESGSSDNQA